MLYLLLVVETEANHMSRDGRRSTRTTCSGDGDNENRIGDGYVRVRIGIGVPKTDCRTGGNSSHATLAAKECPRGVTGG